MTVVVVDVMMTSELSDLFVYDTERWPQSWVMMPRFNDQQPDGRRALRLLTTQNRPQKLLFRCFVVAVVWRKCHLCHCQMIAIVVGGAASYYNSGACAEVWKEDQAI